MENGPTEFNYCLECTWAPFTIARPTLFGKGPYYSAWLCILKKNFDHVIQNPITRVVPWPSFQKKKCIGSYRDFDLDLIIRIFIFFLLYRI